METSNFTVRRNSKTLNIFLQLICQIQINLQFFNLNLGADFVIGIDKVLLTEF